MIEEIEKIIKNYEKNMADIEKLQEGKTKNEEELKSLKETDMPSNLEFENDLREKLEDRKARDFQEIDNDEYNEFKDEFIGGISTKDITKRQIEEEYQKLFDEKMKEHEKELKEEIKKHKAKIRAKDKQIKEKDEKIENKKVEIEEMASDENFKTITMGIAKIDKDINSKKLQLSRKKLEVLEYYDNINNNMPEKNTKTILELNKEQEEIEKEIRDLESNKEKYSEFLAKLKDLRYKTINKEEVVEEQAKPEEVQALQEQVKTEEVVQEQTTSEEEKVSQEQVKPEEVEAPQEQTKPEVEQASQVESKLQEPIEVSYVKVKPEEAEVSQEQTISEEEKQTTQEKNKIIDINNVKIIYDAKTDTYTIENGKGKVAIVERKKLEEKDFTRILADEDVSKNIENLDINVIKLLSNYDNKFGTNKTGAYIGIAEIGKSQEERQNAMEDSQIDIKYNLKGLYDEREIEGEYEEYEDVFTKEEREKILRIANNAKRKGMATVKKGIYVTIREQIDNIANKIKNIKNLLLPEGNDEQIKNDEQSSNVVNEFKEEYKVSEQERQAIKEEGYAELTNAEYMKSLDEKFDKALDERE